MFGVLCKFVQNHDAAKLFCPPLLNPLVWYVYGHNLRVMSLVYKLEKIERKKYFIKLRIEPTGTEPLKIKFAEFESERHFKLSLPTTHCLYDFKLYGNDAISINVLITKFKIINYVKNLLKVEKIAISVLHKVYLNSSLTELQTR